MKKLLAIIAFTSLSVQAAPALPPVVTTLMPVSIKPIMEITHELGNCNHGPCMTSRSMTGGGGAGAAIGGAVAGAALTIAGNAAYEAASERVKRNTGHSIGGHVNNGIDRATSGSGSRGVSFSNTVSNFFSGLTGGN